MAENFHYSTTKSPPNRAALREDELMEPVVNIPPISRPWSLPFDDGLFHFDSSSDSLVDDNTAYQIVKNVHGMEVSAVLAQHIGIGKICCRICYKRGMPSKIRRIWFEWLGNVDVGDLVNKGIPEHAFSILTFSCDKQLGVESAEGRLCEICLQQIFPKKDAGVLIKFSKIVCSNKRAFHIYHLSCIIQLILICEAKDVEQVRTLPPPGTYYIPGAGDEHEQDIRAEVTEEDEVIQTHPMTSSLWCPQCDEPSFASIAECREILTQTREEWVNTPELENCPMGLCFPVENVDTYQEKVGVIDLLHFYRAEY